MSTMEAGDNNGVESNAEGDLVPGRRSIERAIEERLALKLKGITAAESRGFEFKVVAREGLGDDCIRNWKHGKTTKIKESSTSDKVVVDSMAKGDFRVENHQKNELRRGRGETEMYIHQGDHVGSVGETSEGAYSVAGNKVQKVPKTPNHRTLKEVVALRDNNIDDTCVQSASAVDNNHARNFYLDASLVTANKPSTEQATPRVAEKLNLQKKDTELEAYILDRLSWLQPSFRTLYEPSGVGTSSRTVGSSGNKTGQQPGKSRWEKNIEDTVANVTNSGNKKQQESSLESILYERDVKGIVKMRWEEERKKSQAKKRRKWPISWICCCCPQSKNSGRNMEQWEFQLEEYSSYW